MCRLDTDPLSTDPLDTVPFEIDLFDLLGEPEANQASVSLAPRPLDPVLVLVIYRGIAALFTLWCLDNLRGVEVGPSMESSKSGLSKAGDLAGDLEFDLEFDLERSRSAVLAFRLVCQNEGL